MTCPTTEPSHRLYFAQAIEDTIANVRFGSKAVIQSARRFGEFRWFFPDIFWVLRVANITSIRPANAAIVRTDWNRHHALAKSDQFDGGDATVQVFI
jgi:hypothetical protein